MIFSHILMYNISNETLGYQNSVLVIWMFLHQNFPTKDSIRYICWCSVLLANLFFLFSDDFRLWARLNSTSFSIYKGFLSSQSYSSYAQPLGQQKPRDHEKAIFRQFSRDLSLAVPSLLLTNYFEQKLQLFQS